MLIHAATKKVVLNLRDPGRVLNVIPSAKQFTYAGAQLVAVPHRLDETRVLRNLGFDVAAPILHHYSWPGRFKPFHAQSETAAFLTLNPKAFVLNDMGTGKTLATLWAYDYLRSLGRVRKLLVVSPLSTLERTWADEVFQHFPHLSTAVLHGAAARRKKLLALDVDIYLINHDGLKVIGAELAERDDIDIVVVDEIASFRNASTDRWKALNAVCKTRPWVWGLTGTPTPNEPTDAWAQCRLICPERVPKYYGKFRDMVMKQMGQFKWLVRENATEIVADCMQPAIRFTRDQCVDLPPCVYQTRSVPLSTEQSAAYKDMLSKLHMEYESGEVTAVNEAVKMQKLTQIACGVVYGGDGTEIVLPGDGRVAAVKEIVEQAGSKVIVFVPFKSALRHLAAELRDIFKLEVVKSKLHGFHDYVIEISGDTSATQRAQLFREFQQGGPDGPGILVAQPASMSHGLTLTAASTIVWYAPVTSNEVYEQANARVTRPGQKLTQFIVHLEGTAVERRTYSRLKDKQRMQGLLLETLQEE